MASLLSSAHASLLRPALHRRLLFRRPQSLSFYSSASGPGRRLAGGVPSAAVPDEWGEKAPPQAEPDTPSEPDPPKDEDEWGREPRAAGAADEWGEAAEPEEEEPSAPDPPRDEDEWGNGRSAPPSPPKAEDKLGDLKRSLVDTVYGTELGFRASAEVRAEVLELVSQLEVENPTPAPTEAPELLDGNWILLYTAFSELLPLLAIGGTPLLKIKVISQSIDTKGTTIINSTTLSSPFANFSFSASASFEVQSPSRIQVQFKEGTFEPPKISSTVDLPEQADILGQKISLRPVQQALNPLQDTFSSITRALSGLPPLKVPLPGNRTRSWLLTTYLDGEFRISRGDGGLFVLAKEGSPLIDRLS